MQEMILRCNIQNLKAHIVQVIEARQTHDITNLLVQKLSQIWL